MNLNTISNTCRTRMGMC